MNDFEFLRRLTSVKLLLLYFWLEQFIIIRSGRIPVEHQLYNKMKPPFKNFLAADETELRTGEILTLRLPSPATEVPVRNAKAAWE
jgi:hypothetical protein